MRPLGNLVNVLLRFTPIAVVMLACAGYLNVANASGPANTVTNSAAIVDLRQEEPGPVHLPLASVGITQGQTARINVVNSPDPNSSIPPWPVTVEMCFHDSSGDLVLDRSRRPVQKTATIDPHHGDFLDLNGNLVAVPGARVLIVPCVRILSIGRGSLAVPTVEIFNNLIKTTFVLSPGIARGFDPQPDPPVPPEVAFGLVGITPGVTARLYVINAQNPAVGDPHEPITVEIEFHDADGNSFLDRTGRPTRKTMTIDANHADFFELNGNDIAAPGARVGIIPCVKLLRGSASSLVTPTFEMYVNQTQQTLLLNNFSLPESSRCLPTPSIGLSPTSFSFSATAGGANPATQSLMINNTGGGTLSFSANDDAAWLSVQPTSGTAPANLTLTVDVTGLAAGGYNGAITISAVGASNTPLTVPVTLTVGAVGTELIVNGGFEGSASPWLLSGTAFRADTDLGTGSYPHSGAGYLVLGNEDSSFGAAFQQITIPSTAVSADLTFWINITSNETTTTEPLDQLFVEVRNTTATLLSTVATFSNLDKSTVYGNYSKKGSFNLLSFKGQTVRIQFRAATNDALPTTFRIDDVSIK